MPEGYARPSGLARKKPGSRCFGSDALERFCVIAGRVKSDRNLSDERLTRTADTIAQSLAHNVTGACECPAKRRVHSGFCRKFA